MGKKDDGLGLSLSLGCGGPTTATQTHTHSPTTQPSGGGGGGGDGSFLKLNLMQKPPPPPSPSSSSMQYHHHLHPQPKTTSPWNEIFHLSSDRNSDARSFLRGLDVNRTPPSAAAADYYEEENGVSSPNSTVSSISGKRSEREATLGGEEAEEGDRDSCSRGGGGSDDDDGGNGSGDASRKKLRLTKDQSLVLEETFKEHNTLNPKQKLALAKQLNLRPRQVEVWFQNRRARTKLKQTEVDCEYLKRCCENLTEENRRLQKEVQELRALKLSPQLYMHMSPPTTLTMCPSCERVAVSSTSSSTSTTAAPNGPNRQPSVPSIPRPVPINPWAALPIQHRRCDAPASRS